MKSIADTELYNHLVARTSKNPDAFNLCSCGAGIPSYDPITVAEHRKAGCTQIRVTKSDLKPEVKPVQTAPSYCGRDDLFTWEEIWDAWCAYVATTLPEGTSVSTPALKLMEPFKNAIGRGKIQKARQEVAYARALLTKVGL